MSSRPRNTARAAAAAANAFFATTARRARMSDGDYLAEIAEDDDDYEKKQRKRSRGGTAAAADDDDDDDETDEKKQRKRTRSETTAAKVEALKAQDAVEVEESLASKGKAPVLTLADIPAKAQRLPDVEYRVGQTIAVKIDYFLPDSYKTSYTRSGFWSDEEAAEHAVHAREFLGLPKARVKTTPFYYVYKRHDPRANPYVARRPYPKKDESSNIGLYATAAEAAKAVDAYVVQNGLRKPPFNCPLNFPASGE